MSDYNSLPNDQKIQHNMKLSLFQVVSEASSARAEKKLTGKIEKIGASLPLAKMLEELK